MRVSFRQGIIRYPVIGVTQSFLQINGSYINLTTSNGPVEVTIAHGTSDYLISENSTVNAAWGPFATGTNYWIYWDIDVRTGERTFGSTQLAPTVSQYAPGVMINTPAPSEDQHWFDLSRNVMRVFKSGVWRPALRVFAAKFDGVNLTPLGSGDVSRPFSGTQVGLNDEVYAGRIVFDDLGNPIKRSTGEFFTTESQFFASGSRINSIRLESNISLVTANENIPAFSVIKYTATGAQLANYDDTGSTVLAMTTGSIPNGGTDSVVIQGTVSNPLWNFSNIGTSLWVKSSGELVDIDPHAENNVAYPIARVPVARVLSPDTIIFEQGLGGKGEKGEPGSGAGSTTVATPSVAGVVRTTTSNSIVVSTDDPRMADARVPTAHTHAASTVTYTPFGNVSSANVQNAINELDTEKLPKAGGTMTGPLTLSGSPASALHATTKNYVDGLVSGLTWISPIHYVNLISDTVTDPSTLTPNYSDAYIVPAGAVGVWSGMTGKIVIWDGAAWIEDMDDGLLSNHPTGTRFGIAVESSTVPSGSFAGKKNQIAILTNPAGPTWSFYVPVGNNAMFVSNQESLHAYHQYVYDSVNVKWVEFGGGSSIQPGSNITLTGNILDVKNYGSGGTVDAATLQGSSPAAFAVSSHSHTIDALTDTLIATPVGLQYLAWSDVNAAWINADATYDLAFQIFGKPAAGDVVMRFRAARAFEISGNGSQAHCDVTIGTGDPNAVFNIVYNYGDGDIIVGTITFFANNDFGLFNIPTSTVTIYEGEQLKVVAPSPQDATLADLDITIVGRLIG